MSSHGWRVSFEGHGCISEKTEYDAARLVCCSSSKHAVLGESFELMDSPKAGMLAVLPGRNRLQVH